MASPSKNHAYEWTPPPAYDGCECECHKPGVVMLHCIPCCWPVWHDPWPAVMQRPEFKPAGSISTADADEFARRLQAETIAFSEALGIETDGYGIPK